MPDKTACLVLALLAGLVAGGPAPAAEPWAGFRGAHGIGEAAEPPPGEGALALSPVWKRPLGSGYSGISIAGGRLITAGACGERDCVVALDAATGEERWRFDLAPAHRGHDGSHDGPISTPAVADGRVFALAPAGQLAAVDLETGEALWRVHLVDDLGCEKPFYDFGSSPRVIGNTVVVQVGGTAGSVAAFDAGTGELRWRAVADRVVSQTPVAAELAGRRQVVVLGLERLAGLDPADGAVLWEWRHEGGRGISAYASPVPLHGDRVLVQYKNDATAVVAVAADGDRLVPEVVGTSRGLTHSYSPPTRSGAYVFGYTGRFLSAIDPASGELLWRSRDPGDGFLIAVGDRLAVLTKKGSLHLGAADPGGWHETGRLDLFDDLAWTPPSYAGGAIYVRSLGEIARVDLVRVSEPVVASEAPRLPAALTALAAEVAAAEHPGAVVDAFLAEREPPLVNGDEVVFVWRGEAEDVAIAGDMIGMRTEEPMHRLDGTDLWWWATELDPRARMSYVFYVDYEPTTDPAHDRTVDGTVLGADRNWNRGEPVPMSWFAMPRWPGREPVAPTPSPSGASGGRLESFDLELQPGTDEHGETPGPVTATIRVWLPPGYDDSTGRYPVVYLRDDAALDVGGWPGTLDRVVGTRVAPLIAVFAELPRMPDADAAFTGQVVPAVDERFRTLADRDHRAVVGMGWGGLMATVTAFAEPDTFGLVGVQSFYALEASMDWLRETMGEADASTLPLTIYLEWGRWDLISPNENMNMRESARDAWDLLRGRGWQPVGGEVWDSTDWASWRNRTGVMLEALFPMDGIEPGLDRWRTGEP